MLVELMAQIEQESSTTEKKRLLAEACQDPVTFLLLQQALDVYTTFGITVDKERVMAGLVDDSSEEIELFGPVDGERRQGASRDEWWQAFLGLLPQLAARQLTGHAAQKAVYGLLASAPSALDADWATRVLNKDLLCGVGATTLNAVVPGAVRVFSVALAAPMFKKNGELAVDPELYMQCDGFVEPKIDGERVIIVDAVALSRYGREIVGEGAGPVVEQLREIVARVKSPPFNALERWVFDGELIGEGTFEQTIGQIRTKGRLMFHVFDLMTRVEWTCRDTRKFSVRRRELERMLDGVEEHGLIKLVPSLPLRNATMEQLLLQRDYFISLGYEGAMWKRASAPYSFCRSADVVKVKPWETFDYRVVGWYPGTNKYVGLLGGVELDVDGVVTRCGSGFSDKQRKQWRSGPDFEWAEVKFQNKTAAESLRHPVFLRPRYDKEG